MNDVRRNNTTEPTPDWTIDDLGAQVALALSIDYEGQANGQISDVPKRRTIRYYTMLGLLDRPSAMRGRTALYGRRHLLQLVAIKRLQAEGLSLAEIQERLATVSDSTLSRIADLPPFAEAETRLERRPSRPDEVPRSRDFWTSAPSDLPDDEERDEPATTDASDAGERVDAATPRVHRPSSTEKTATTLQCLGLAEGVSLLVETERALSGLDLDAIETAAAPLLALLRARGLAPPSLGDDR